MTSAKDAPRGKGDVAIGISKVPDTRLDTLTAMYNPRKRVPATVEFTDNIAPARTGAQALVDVAVAERRLERIERDLKKGKSTELEKERDLVQRCQRALEAGTPLRALQLAGDDLKRLRGFQLLSAKPLLLVINLDEADVADAGADIERAAEKTGLIDFLAH